MKFGHHQSFYLRVNWISKAMKMLEKDKAFFYDPFGFEQIGLGRNMVKALRYWMTATGLMAEGKNEEKKSIHTLTETGSILRQYDRFARLPLTAMVLHTLLASDKVQASTWYWYFNEFNHRSATGEEMLAALQEWIMQQQGRVVSVDTLKRDIDCLKLMYTARARIDDDPEEVVASPLSNLGLLHETKEVHAKRTPELAELDADGLYYCLLHYCNRHGVDSVTLEEIQFKPMLWGRLFHLSSGQILEGLEMLNADVRYPVSFVRTNQIYSLNMETELPCAFLRKAYEWKAAY